MFYRRKVILALLQAFGGSLPQINLYKLLLIISKQQEKPEYEFVPYLYGCYSFSLHADLVTMSKKKLIREDSNKILYKLDKKNYLPTLKEMDKKIVLSTQSRFNKFTQEALIKYTYTAFPYTAIRSEIAQKILSSEQQEEVKRWAPASDKTILFTIGYEGISLEEYLNRLLLNNIQLLVDVRNNPVSMKFGFSKNQIKGYCEKLQIGYVHIPEVGIQSNLRQELNTQSDYNKLFSAYKKHNLSQTQLYQQRIFDLLKEKKRIALTCFEANICQCHRKHLAEAISQIPGWKYELKHI